MSKQNESVEADLEAAMPRCRGGAASGRHNKGFGKSRMVEPPEPWWRR